MKENVEAMEGELRGLLRRGAPGLDAPEGAHERILERLATVIPVGLGGGPGSGGASGSGGGPTTEPLATPKAPGGTLLLSARGLAAVALAFGLGAGLTSAALRARPEPVRVVYVDRAVPETTPVASTSARQETASIPFDTLPKSVPSSQPSVTPQKPVASASANAGVRMNEERLLVDAARVAYSRGDTAGCLTLLEKHRSVHPTGLLSEEREALAVRVLMSAGRKTEARERGSRFEKRYPGSVMLPAVLAALKDDADPQ